MAKAGTLSIKNGKIEFIKFGKGERVFIILPGLSYDGFFDKAEEIERAYTMFTKKFTVYLIDRNLTPKATCSIKDIVEDTAETLKTLGINKADFFGASLGGMVAAKLAIDHPNLVGKLVLGSTLARPNETYLNVLTRWETIAKSGEIDALMSDINRNIYSPKTLKKYADVFAKIETTATDEKTARFITYINAAKTFDVYNSLNKITSKTLVIGALKDKITTVFASREIAKSLHSSYYEYKKYGHAVFDEAVSYKKLIYQFLTK